MTVLKGIEKYCVDTKMLYFTCSKGDFYAKNNLAILNVSENPQKNRQGVGASWSVLLYYLHPYKLIYDRYPNKDNRDALGGIIITRRDVISVTRREQLCIFMKHRQFEDHELHCVQKWVRVIREIIETHVFEDS